MRIAENKYYMYKADKVEIVDLTNDVISAECDRGEVTNLGDGYTDSPNATMSISLQNSNNRLYSPHFKANKVKYDMSQVLVGNGGSSYASPKLNTISVTTPNINYGCTYVKGKIELSHNLLIGQTLEIWVTYIDIDEKNPINHLSNNSYSPLIQEKNTFVWEQSIKDVNFENFEVIGNGTNKIILNKKLDDVFLLTIATLISKNGIYVLTLEQLYALTLEQIYSIELLKEKLQIGDTASIVSFTTTSNSTTITFDRVINTDEKVFVSGKIITLIDSELKFVGKVTSNVKSDIKTCSFTCKDLSYDLQEVKIEPSNFRKYFTEKEGNNIYTTEEKITKCIVNNNNLSVSYNNLNDYFTNNEEVYLYNDQTFKKTNLVITGNLIATVTGIANGNYSIYKKYVPSLSMEKFIQNCIEDCGLTYNLFIKDFSNFSIIPKVSEMQMDNLWTFIQSIVAKRGMCLHFIYTKSSETYYNLDGTTKQGTNSFELVLQEIPQNNTVSKFTLEERQIESDTQFDSTGSLLINSYTMNYLSAETNKVEKIVVDDFIKSTYQATILTERNIITTYELLQVGASIRLGNEYRQVIRAINSSTYEVNLAFSESGTFDLYQQGTYSTKWGVKRAFYDIDSTTEIDTAEEARNFALLLLNQYLDIYATYQFKVYSRYFPFLKNFDVIKINSPRYNLLNKNMFVQSVKEDSQFTTFTCSEIMHLGKWKYYEMKVEKGLNTITDTTKINTADVFPPVNNLTALEPRIDDLKNYVAYSRLSWNKLVGMNVTSYEVQYKKSTEDWENAEVVTLSENSLKLVLKEQVLYNIRVRGTGKEQVKGKWAYVDVDASLFLIENPIQNRTWYIRLFKGNYEEEYFNKFNLLEYTNQYLIDNIDTIEIVPNADKGNKLENYVVWCKDKYTVPSDESTTHLRNGLQQLIIEKLGSFTGKNLFFRNVFNGYYLLEGDSKQVTGGYIGLNSYIDSQSFKNIDAEGTQVVFKMLKTGVGLLNYEDNLGQKKTIKNFKIQMNRNDFTNGILLYTGIFSNSFQDFPNARTNYENIVIEFTNTNNTYTYIGYRGINNANKVQVIGATTGYSTCRNISESKANNCNTGFFQCTLLTKNTSENSTTKYDTCYSSLSINATYLIDASGSDNVNGGFNT